MTKIPGSLINSHLITLDIENHRYILTEDPQVGFISCTTLVSQFFSEFNALKIATKLTNSHPKYKHRTPADLMSEWDDARDEGTFAHKEIEEYITKGKKPVMPKSKAGVEWLNKHIDLSGEVYPELIVFSEELGIAGTVDLLVYNTRTDKYDIYDWKTNKSIDEEAWGGKCGTKPPTYDLPDCNFYHYSLQLSLYKYLLENYHDVEIGDLTLLHLKKNGVTPYDCEYLEDTVLDILEYGY